MEIESYKICNYVDTFLIAEKLDLGNIIYIANATP